MHRSVSDIGIEFQDLECLCRKRNMFTRNCGRGGYPDELITIEDDEDDDHVLVYSPRPRETLSSGGAMGFVPISSSSLDLELRLGFIAHDGGAAGHNVGRREPVQTWKLVKTTAGGMASSSRQRTTKEVKLKCMICMDTMKKETSTVCGHVFCKSCITSAIRAQKKCPTCRKVLSMANIHRIYLPETIS